MLRLLKRTRLKEWEVQLLKNVINSLPDEYHDLISQIDDGLLKGVIVDASDIPGYIAFTFQGNILKKYERENTNGFILTNIAVFDKHILSFLTYTIYINGGVITGYSITGNNDHKIDVTRIIVSDFKKEYLKTFDFARIKKILSKEELQVINRSEVYSVFVNDKEYFHLKDLEDGNFIGIDFEKNVYRINHNPENILKTNMSIWEALNSKL